MSIGKEQEIVEEARRYVDAVRFGEKVSRSISSAQTSAQVQAARANTKEKAKIFERLEERITRLTEEASREISPPTKALNALVLGIDAPVPFDYEGHEYRVVPHTDVPRPRG